PPRRVAGQGFERQVDAGRVLVALRLAHAEAPWSAEAAFAASRAAAACAVTGSHADGARRDRSTGFCTSRILSPCTMLRDPSHALTQTQGMSGSTSQWPLARTPPQGPLRNCLGQFIGHDMPVDDRMHCPHMRQSNMNPLTRFSM